MGKRSKMLIGLLITLVACYTFGASPGMNPSLALNLERPSGGGGRLPRGQRGVHRPVAPGSDEAASVGGSGGRPAATSRSAEPRGVSVCGTRVGAMP